MLKSTMDKINNYEEIMEYTEKDLTEEMLENIWNEMMNQTCGDNNPTTTYVSISAQKEDQLGLQWSAIGTYHDEDDNPLFDFELESGINNGSIIHGIYPPDEAPALPEQRATICRFFPKKVTPLSIKKLTHSTIVQENNRKMCYDLTVTGCGKAAKYWDNYANTIGAEIKSYTGTAEELSNFDKLYNSDPRKALELL